MTIRVDVPISDLQVGDRITALISYDAHTATIDGIVWQMRDGSLAVGNQWLDSDEVGRIDLVSASPRPQPPVGSVVACDGCGESFVRVCTSPKGWIRIGEEIDYANTQDWQQVNATGGCLGHIKTVYAPA